MMPKLDSSAVTSEVFLVSKQELETDFFTGFGYADGSSDMPMGVGTEDCSPLRGSACVFLGCDEVSSLLSLLLLQLCVCVGLGRDYAEGCLLLTCPGSHLYLLNILLNTYPQGP